MSVVRPLPQVGSVHLDTRGDERALRISWHPESGEGVVVLSIWRENVCTGTVRLTADQLPGIIATLEQALGSAPGSERRPPLLA